MLYVHGEVVRDRLLGVGLVDALAPVDRVQVLVIPALSDQFVHFLG